MFGRKSESKESKVTVAELREQHAAAERALARLRESVDDAAFHGRDDEASLRAMVVDAEGKVRRIAGMVAAAARHEAQVAAEAEAQVRRERAERREQSVERYATAAEGVDAAIGLLAGHLSEAHAAREALWRDLPSHEANDFPLIRTAAFNSEVQARLFAQTNGAVGGYRGLSSAQELRKSLVPLAGAVRSLTLRLARIVDKVAA